jgi:hypothetical protein
MGNTKKTYEPPKPKQQADTKPVVLGAVHKGCASVSARSKKG